MPDTLITAPQIYYKTASEVRGVAVDMRGVLRHGEILTGSPTVTVSGPTASSAAVTTAVQLINGESVEPGKAITFTISGGSDGSDYIILVSCATSASQTVNSYVILKVRVPTVAAP
jgi:hypothetical protein